MKTRILLRGTYVDSDMLDNFTTLDPQKHSQQVDGDSASTSLNVEENLWIYLRTKKPPVAVCWRCETPSIWLGVLRTID